MCKSAEVKKAAMILDAYELTVALEIETVMHTDARKNHIFNYA
jgi:hypothetical protein